MKQPIIILFLGAPGSGKTTYSQYLSKIYTSLNRNITYVNLDCSNSFQPEKGKIDYKEILNCDEILSELHIGPNSAIFFSIEYLYENLWWLEREMESVNLESKNNIFFFDLPGQIELFTHHYGIKSIIKQFGKNQYFLFSLILSDSFFWYDETNFHVLALTNLMIIFNTELMFYHILTKTDLLENCNYSTKNCFHFFKNEKTVFSWSKKLKFSIEDIIFDFGMISPVTVNLSKNHQILNLIKYLDQQFKFRPEKKPWRKFRN